MPAVNDARAGLHFPSSDVDTYMDEVIGTQDLQTLCQLHQQVLCHRF